MSCFNINLLKQTASKQRREYDAPQNGFQHDEHLQLPAALLCLSADGINRRHHSSIASASITAFDMESIFQLDHVFLHYSHTHTDTQKRRSYPHPSPSTSFPLFQSEKILFIHQRRRTEVEHGGKLSSNRIKPPENNFQTYLSCRKTAAPPRRPPSLRLRPGRRAATCTCQSPAAPYLQKEMRVVDSRCETL